MANAISKNTVRKNAFFYSLVVNHFVNEIVFPLLEKWRVLKMN